jgi:hypothetical protein
MQRGAERHDAGRQFGRRVRLRETAAEGAAIADGAVGDERDRAVNERREPGHGGRAADGAVPRESADAQMAVALLDRLEPGDAVDVDEESRLEQAHVERRYQTLPAGEDLRVIAVSFERREYVVQRIRAAIVESRRLHDPSPVVDDARCGAYHDDADPLSLCGRGV